ncbi:CBL-interacting serine/threonine-protein kinase 23 [Gossypium australe]|uniref:non-specific serine/threonine protein kinase n=1 Tax=Gossypium australe TaxID=47621 RepID=A0A5B6TNE2_9ROSI|nr:CBL-interacting serine/threonine-protein kinase 23 [Gossypium australe]
MANRTSAASKTRVGKYELGRTLGEGSFAKVKFAKNIETGENVAIKIVDKEKVLKHKMIGQIKREISTMKLIRHPNVIRMYEVMASKIKVYIVLEFVSGGELFNKIASRGRFKEDEARKYFQQLINAVDYCHSRGVYHRDLKPENLLLDANGVLKVSDFGLSALPQQVGGDGLLHTTCGTPNYVAPEVINNKGYHGAKADLWSCGVILFVLMVGYLPFEHPNLMGLYKKVAVLSFFRIFKADFDCPPWFSSSAKKLIKRILDPNPLTRITVAEIIENEWFKKGYIPPRFERADVSLDDVDAIFNESRDSRNLVEQCEEGSVVPATMNAFELISTSQGLNLSSLFEKQMGLVKRETRFTSKCPANEIISKIEKTAMPMGFGVKKNNYKMKLLGEKTGRKGHLAVTTEVAPSLFMVELRKSEGDTLEFHKILFGQLQTEEKWKKRKAKRKRGEGSAMREEVISSGGTIDPTPAASSAGASSPAVPTNVGSVDWSGHGQNSKAASQSCVGSQAQWISLYSTAGGSALGSSRTSCRPWERGDLLRRLATFKPVNWFGKPKVASSLSCARRGWINIDVDKIACETCGACLNFASSPSWATSEAEDAGQAFSKQLDVGHKVACTWRGNSCPESLVQFPPTPQSALIAGYKDRCDGLMQFQSLPVVAASAVEHMRVSRGPQLDRLLYQLQNHMAEFESRSESILEAANARDGAFCLYSCSQKLISLCGWEPRWLLNVQDCEEHSAQSARNGCSFGPNTTQVHRSQDPGPSKNALIASGKDTGKNKLIVVESRSEYRSPLLDCSLCGATVRILDFLTVPRPARVAPNIDIPDTSKKMGLTRGVSAASGISGWVAIDDPEKEPTEDRDEVGTTDERNLMQKTDVELNLTMAGSLSFSQLGRAASSRNMNDADMGRDLMIGQPSDSEVGDRAASYESRGPSSHKRSLEIGASSEDRPQLHPQQADSVEGTVIDRDGDEVTNARQYSAGPSKRARDSDIFDPYCSPYPRDSSDAGPSHAMGCETSVDGNKVALFRQGSSHVIGIPSARDSTRASSVIAMDTVCHSADDDSMESVENYRGDVDDIHFPSSSIYGHLDMNDTSELNYSNQAQQSICFQPTAAVLPGEVGISSTNDGDEIFNAETVTAHARDGLSFGISGGSVGMCASHEADIHGADVSVHRTDSVVGDIEPRTEDAENQGQTGESAPDPGLMDEVVPDEIDREDPLGDSREMLSRSLGRDDSGSKVDGSAKAESIESGEKISQSCKVIPDKNAHPSLSCNANVYSGNETTKEIKNAGKSSSINNCTYPDPDSDLAVATGIGPPKGESNYEEAIEFDPIIHHNQFCPWVNGNVAAAGCSGYSSSTSCSNADAVALCGWQLTLDALDALRSLGHIPVQTVQSESAASLHKI